MSAGLLSTASFLFKLEAFGFPAIELQVNAVVATCEAALFGGVLTQLDWIS